VIEIVLARLLHFYEFLDQDGIQEKWVQSALSSRFVDVGRGTFQKESEIRVGSLLYRSTPYMDDAGSAILIDPAGLKFHRVNTD
jgi:hypothetical protein